MVQFCSATPQRSPLPRRSIITPPFTFVPLGLVSILVSVPMLRHKRQPAAEGASGPIDWAGALLLFVAAVVFILSGTHLHVGEESFTSSEALSYHVPMNILFLVLLGAFIAIERLTANPVVDLKHFRERAFSLSLGSNTIFHGSMLATMTLVPILVEEGFGRSPIFVTAVLFPSQFLGLFMPMVAGWIYDKYSATLSAPVVSDTYRRRVHVPEPGRTAHLLLGVAVCDATYSHWHQHVQPGQ